MPRSEDDQIPYFLEVFEQLQPKTVLDIGAGEGKYADLIAKRAKVNAIEIWAQNVMDYDLPSKYDEVFIWDARKHQDFDYDLVIFGDVLEHMSEEDAKALWAKARKGAKAIFMSIPIVHLPQGAEGGNPYEVHIEDDYDHERILETFEGITEFRTYPRIGAYLAL
jgi:cyclopropane fatty-acyl-phospholipid synthase-like methyltransferase